MQSDKWRILCAENYEDTREYLVIWLGRAGYEVTTSDTVAECVELAASRHFHLYLIGERFPDGSGFDLVEKIRSFDGQTPLVFHSALAYPKDIERGLKAGAQAYITKPSDPEHLMETIRLLIDTDDRKERGFPTAAINS
ncbi:MAG TPA: response regulator [Blastocatellia bacterium]|nr:response regulator [Blastocatellia bacterium]